MHLKFPEGTLTNPDNQGITIPHKGKTYLIINDKLIKLSDEDAKYFNRFSYYELNYLIRNNLLA